MGTVISTWGPVDFGGIHHKNSRSSILCGMELSLQRSKDSKSLGMLSTHSNIMSVFFFLSRKWPFTQVDQPSHTCHVQVPASFQQQSQSPLPCCCWAGEWAAVACHNLFPINSGQLEAEEKFITGVLWMSQCENKQHLASLCNSVDFHSASYEIMSTFAALLCWACCIYSAVFNADK